MSSWGNNDNAANAPYWAVSSAITHGGSIATTAAAPDAANVALLYGNTTPDLYVSGQTVGLFMVNAGETTAGGANVADISIIQGGSQYAEVPAVTFSGGGGTSAAATAYISGGVVNNIQVTNGGAGYTSNPTVTIANPTISMVYTDVSTSTDVFTYSGTDTLFATGDAVIPVLGGGTRISLDAVTFANTAISANTITTTNPYVLGDYVVLTKNSGTTPTGLTDGGNYFAVPTGTNTFKLAPVSATATNLDAGEF